ncbi:ABC-2 transporter permease [Lysinibacillus parviboronicapiens]|uniref:ABC-2 transporter permease n=1 Tax=Lysinibacillus parviboronicapiens TaxID=436516 RepID=UPI000D3AB653|nr:ABC-2 transporter permease [Lysinibacillus parviboronicapiens]
MKALLWHRISMQKFSIVSVLIVCIVFNFISIRYFDSFSMLFFIVIFSVNIVSSFYEQDKRANWELFVNSLPLARKTQLTTDFLFCYCQTLCLFIVSAPFYFMRTDEYSSFSEHFALYFANISCAILLICIQFYIQHVQDTKSMKNLRMFTAIFLIFLINYPIHYYLSLVAGNLLVLLVPTIISTMISIFVFRKCLTLFVAKEIF